MDDSPPSDQTLRHAEVVAEHLPSGYGATFDGTPAEYAEASSSTPELAEPTEESSLLLQGGDIHRDLFKTAARGRMHRRAHTFNDPSSLRRDDEEDVLAVSNQLAPGGFRRAFIHQNQEFLAARIPVTRNFVEFLDLYGSFAGEDLVDSDEEAIEEEEEAEGPAEQPGPEGRPLLGQRRRSARGLRAANASTTKTFFTLLKAFIGTGIMFLPKAFSNGGILFSSLTLLVVAAVSMVCFHLLLACKKRYAGGYGEIGEAIRGNAMRGLILGSITLSQLGFVCAGIVFTAENLQSFCNAVTKGGSPLTATSLVLVQLAVLIPLGFIRNISKLGPAALLADVFICIGLVYIYYYDIGALASHGINKSVVLFNPEKYTMMIGSAIFTFEGIGLILPIESSMRKPERFEWLLGVVMIIITIIFTSVGILCYATFGINTHIEIINNYPQGSKFVNAVQFLYSIAVLVGDPVQLFPAIRIIEGKVFGRRSGRKSLQTKWKKNALRTFIILLCATISIISAGNLDRFVALIGSFACVPLVYIYPPYLHYKGVAASWRAKTVDIILMSLGTICMVYTTVVTVRTSFLH